VLSVVIPLYNEEEVVPLLFQRLEQVLRGMAVPWEVVFVNDGSRDATSAVLARLAQAHPSVVVLELSRNFGHQAALTAGLDHARGDAVIVMDGDLQDPPELVPELFAQYRAGYDVVYAQRLTRQDEPRLRLLSIHLFYWLMARFVHETMPRNVGDFRLMSRPVVEVLRSLPESNRFHRGLVSWVGFRQTAVPYDRPGRARGNTKYPLRKLVALALDGVTAFSYGPLRLGVFVGGATVACTALFLGWVAFSYLSGRPTPPGWISLASLLTLLNGVVVLFLGLIGEYIGRIFVEVKRRPPYIVMAAHNRALEPGRTPSGGFVHGGLAGGDRTVSRLPSTDLDGQGEEGQPERETR
jgi:dolichol-phosphate mannosyltransferase